MNPAQENYEIARNMFASGNEIQAVRLIEKAADQGCADAQFAMGRLYEIGYIGTGELNSSGEMQLTDKHYAESLSFYSNAAKQGHADALYALGAIYEYGKGFDIDYKLAMDYYKKSALLNNPMAQYAVGCLYANGNGVTKDLQEGVRWFERAISNAPDESREYLRFEYDLDYNMSLLARDLISIYISGAPGIPADMNKVNKYAKLGAAFGNPAAFLYALQEYGSKLNSAMKSTRYITSMNNSQVSASVRFIDFEIPIGKRIIEILAVSTERQNDNIVNQVYFYRNKARRKNILIADINNTMDSDDNRKAALEFLKIAVKYVAEDEGVPPRMRGVFD